MWSSRTSEPGGPCPCPCPQPMPLAFAPSDQLRLVQQGPAQNGAVHRREVCAFDDPPAPDGAMPDATQHGITRDACPIRRDALKIQPALVRSSLLAAAAPYCRHAPSSYSRAIITPNTSSVHARRLQHGRVRVLLRHVLDARYVCCASNQAAPRSTITLKRWVRNNRILISKPKDV